MSQTPESAKADTAVSNGGSLVPPPPSPPASDDHEPRATSATNEGTPQTEGVSSLSSPLPGTHYDSHINGKQWTSKSGEVKASSHLESRTDTKADAEVTTPLTQGSGSPSGSATRKEQPQASSSSTSQRDTNTRRDPPRSPLRPRNHKEDDLNNSQEHDTARNESSSSPAALSGPAATRGGSEYPPCAAPVVRSPYTYGGISPTDTAFALAPHALQNPTGPQPSQLQRLPGAGNRSRQRSPMPKSTANGDANGKASAHVAGLHIGVDALAAYPGARMGSGGGTSEAGSYSPGGRQAELRGQLITAEREVAELREECARRGIAIDTLEAALDRERAASQAMRDHRVQDLEEARNEHEAQSKQLRDQIRVLKMVSESAMADKAKVTEEATRRKKELLALLEREREEKRFIMADYREQTESLIAEQGKEITALRAALDKVKEDYDRLAAEHEQALNVRDGLGDQVEELRGQVDKERLEGARRLKAVQERLTEEKEALHEELDARQDEYARASTAAQARQQELSDQLQQTQAKLAKLEEEHRRGMEGLRQTYRRDTEALEKELAAVKALRERQEEEHQRELEKASRNGEKSAEALRQALEEAHAAKEMAITDAHRQREELQAQHRARLAQVQNMTEISARELALERGARKDAQTEVEVLRVRADNLDKALQDMNQEFEAVQVEARTRERASEAAHQAELEEVKAKVRGLTNELSHAQQQQRQQTQEVQKLREDLASKSNALEQSRAALQEMEAHLEAEAGKQADAHAEREKELEERCEELKSANAALEAARVRLDRALKDTEARFKSVTRQAEEERAALEDTSRQLSEARTAVDDLRHALVNEKNRSASLEDQKSDLAKELQESRLQVDEAQAAARMHERKAQEAAQDLQRHSKANDGKLAEQAQRHKAEVAAARMSTEQVRGELTRARETLQSKEAALQELREEINQLHREAALREGTLSEELEDMKEYYEEEIRRMDELLNGLRADLAKSQGLCTQYQRELAQVHRSADGRYSDLEAALEESEAARGRLQDDAKYREQLNHELQGTVRLLTARLGALEEELKRTQEELTETSKKVQDAHTLIGRKDAAVGQLNAKLRAYESRGGIL